MNSSPILSRVAKLVAPRQLIFEQEILNPSALKPDDVLAETLYSAISVGTEVAAYRGEPPLRPCVVYPRLVGYCNVAEIVAVGSGIDQFRRGDRILTVQSHRSAFICPAESIVVKLPDQADPVEATTTYLFQFSYNALLKGDFAPGQRVAVIGLGTLGLAAVALVHALGGNVVGFSAHEDGRVKAREFGAQSAFDKSQDHVTGDYDLVVTTSNGWPDWLLALQLARKDGCVCVLGFPGRSCPIPDFNPLDSQFFYDKQLRLIACGHASASSPWKANQNCEYLLKRICQGDLPARGLISSIEPWEKLADIYEELAERTVSALTRVLRWKQ